LFITISLVLRLWPAQEMLRDEERLNATAMTPAPQDCWAPGRDASRRLSPPRGGVKEEQACDGVGRGGAQELWKGKLLEKLPERSVCIGFER
jgi:hypothetical protein